MMKKIAILPSLIIAICLLLAGCSCKHEWKEATCTEPKTCTKCGETEGDALGHTPGEWGVQSIDYVSTIVWLHRPCTVCGKDLDTDMKALTTLVEDEKFLFSADEFTDRLRYMFKYHFNQALTAGLKENENDSVVCMVLDNKGGIAATTLFSNKSDDLIADKNERQISKLVFGFKTDNTDDRIRIVLATMLTTDPALELDDAKIVGAELIANGKCTKNSICYALGKLNTNGGLYVMTVSLA